MTSRRDFLAGAVGACACAALPRAIAAALDAPRPAWPMPPVAPRIPATVGRFGYSRPDDLAWLRPKDWPAVLRDPSMLEAPIRAQLDAENAYARAMLAPTEPLQAQLRARLAELGTTHRPPPALRSGGYAYSTREPQGGGLPVHVRRRVDGGDEQVLLDVAAEARGRDHYALHAGSPRRSADGRLVGWAADEDGSGRLRLHVRAIDDGRKLVDGLEGVSGEFTFSADGRHLYRVAREAPDAPSRVLVRALDSGDESTLHVEPDPAAALTLRTTAMGGYVVIGAGTTDATEVRLVPAQAPTAAPVLVEPRTPGLRYEVEEWAGRLLIRTNADDAYDYKLVTADIARPGRVHWQPLVPHVAGRPIHAVHPFDAALVREEWRDALPRLVLMRDDGSEQDVAFEEPAYALQVPAGQDASAEALSFVFTSPRLPPAPRLLDLATGRHVADGDDPSIPGIVLDPSRYEVRRLFARAEDGAQVPITVLMRAGQGLDGSAPLLLNGYGSHGISLDADFEAPQVALVDRGWIHAVAHVRGGVERGHDWWQSSTRTGKMKTFTDFIACADALVAGGYGSAGRIVAFGLSAGGTLMGVVGNLRPELWAGLIAPVAFMDVLTTLEAFEDHPLQGAGIPIWGDPRIPAEHAHVASYSPYDQLRAQPYPAMFVTGVVDDAAVSFWEPVKYAIKARSLTTAGNPILCHTETAGGHLSPWGAYPAIEQQAAYLAFAIWAVERRWGDVPQRPAG